MILVLGCDSIFPGSPPPPQVRDQLPHLKAIVQYKGKLSQEYENVYDVSNIMM